MRHSLTALFLAAVLASGQAFAQAEGAAAEDAEAPAADTAIDGLSLGQVEGEVQVGQTYVREEHGDWELRCVRSEDGNDPCQLYQLLRDSEGNSVAEFNIFPLPDGAQAVAGANVITPLETLLTANLRLAIDGGKAKIYPYSFCSRIGCFARIGLMADEVAAFRKGTAARVFIVPAASPNQTVELSLSLSGFTAGFNALAEYAKGTAPAASE